MVARPRRAEPRLDLFAAAASTLCLVHCLALPLMGSVLPIVAGLSGNDQVHKALVLCGAPATLWVATRALHEDGGSAFVVAAVGGLALLLFAAFIAGETGYGQRMTLAGGCLVASAHLAHWVRCRGEG